jgi:hypothetical protein
MSRDLHKAQTQNQSYLQSPVDDLWSFFYVGQWAAAFNNESLDPSGLPDLLVLRNKLAGSVDTRKSATTDVAEQWELQPSVYGPFFAKSHALLRVWRTKLVELSNWERRYLETGNSHHWQHFKDSAKRSVMDYLHLLQANYDSL